jgi:outer membrane lipoprotein SlyB
LEEPQEKNMSTYDQVQPGSTASPANAARTLWVAVGALSVAVLAMGATLFYVVTKPSLPMSAATAAAQPAAALPATPATVAAVQTPAAPAPVAQAAPAPKPVVKPAPKPAPVHVAKAEQPVYAPAPQPMYPPVVQAPVRQICQACGTVETVNAVERKGAGTGLGAVAGGALGAVLGNQVGKGSGRTAATVLGAVAGGVGGHMAEKHIRKETVYQVGVRMEDGSLRTLEQASPVGVGTRVTVEGNTLRGPQGQVYSAPAPQPAPRPVQVNQPIYNPA